MTVVMTSSTSFSPDTNVMIGESEPMRRLRALIEAVAPTRLPVLIQGPTGSGKELVANAIHARSSRRGAFVPFNVCAISDTMFEDALFGHVRGAFTGAMNDVPGFLREADGGTVFLDEVSGLLPALQAKLLRAIETGIFRPVGAKHDVRSEFRIVAATNERVHGLVAEGRFRADFVHRIGAVTVDVPTLEERPDDIPSLVRHFLDTIGNRHIAVGDDAIQLLQSYAWPGNVRELRHVVEWAVAFSNGSLCIATLRQAIARQSSGERSTQIDAYALVRHELRELLDRNHGSTDLAAKQLGIHRATLYRRLKRYGLAP